MADIPALLDSMDRLYVEDGSAPFRRETHRHATEELLDSPDVGHIYVIDIGTRVVGYAVLTWGYSLEHGGRHGVLDELYIAPGYRGKGLARTVLRYLEGACRERGIRAVHLEVERSNKAAQRLYQSHGFREHDRCSFTKELED